VPILVWEKALSPHLTESVEAAAYEQRFGVAGTIDEVAVRVAVEAFLNPTAQFTNQVLGFQSYVATHEGAGIWDVVINWGKALQRGSTAEPFPPDNPVYNFEIGTQTTHVTQAKETIGTYVPAGQTAPDFQGAIGVNGESVEGTDVNVPTLTWSETWAVPQGTVNDQYLKTIFDVASAPVNNAPWRTFDEGEVLFLGASGTEKDKIDFEITFRFSASPNAQNLTIGTGANKITIPAKKGWEYLWMRYQDVVSAKSLVKQPVAATVVRVYDTSDFSQLGIGP